MRGRRGVETLKQAAMDVVVAIVSSLERVEAERREEKTDRG